MSDDGIFSEAMAPEYVCRLYYQCMYIYIYIFKEDVDVKIEVHCILK
jgi:hypothetical protein